jgi:hypothetical protein
MEKKLLLTLGAEQGSFHKLRFVSEFFTDKSEVRLTLFYAAPRVFVGEGDLRPSWDFSRGEKLTAEAREMLLQRGFAKDSISVKVAGARKDAVVEICEEAERGLYDAVVVGSRGMGPIEELVESSVSHGVLNQSISFPVWICNRPEAAGRDVLLCVDDSDHSRRMADHVGFMLADQPSRRVVVLHVEEEPGGPAEKALEGAIAALSDNGVLMDQVKTRLLNESAVRKAIAAETDAGDFAAVAVGMSPPRLTTIARIFGAPTGLKLLSQIKAPSLWVSR